MPQVVVLGSSGFDLTIRLARLPERGETLLGGELHTGPGGKGANQAIAARRAGADVVFLTAFGDDEFGRRIAEHDRREGLDLSHAKHVQSVANQVALILVDEAGENLIGVAPGASTRLGPNDIDRVPDSVFAPDGVFLTCLELPVATVVHGLRRAHAAGMTTVLNPAPADRTILEDGVLELVDVLTPNQEEARALTGLDVDTPEEILEAGRELLSLGPRNVVMTLGRDGCLALNSKQRAFVPSYSVRVVDTVGAGDAFNGALAVALAERRPLESACEWACAAGALAVTRPGAQGALPNRIDIDELIALSKTRYSPEP